MKFNEAIKILQDNHANNIYDIYVPSLKKSFPWRYMTVAEQITLAKMSIDNNHVSYYKGLMALIMTTYAGENFEKDIGIDNLTEIDKMAILAKIKGNSTTKDNTRKIKCPECDESFDLKIKYDKIAKDIVDNINLESVEHIQNIKGVNYKFILSWPKMKANLDIYKWIDKKTKDASEDNQTELIVDGVYTEIVNIVSNVYINDDKIDDYESLSIDDKYLLFKSLPSSLVDESDDNSLVMCISKNFNDSLNKIYNISCPACKKKLKYFIDPENFFLES